MCRSGKPFPYSSCLLEKVRSLLLLCTLGCGLLWIFQPALAGQRRGILSGDQLSLLQKQAMSRQQLKTIYFVLSQYAADHEGVFPALESAVKLKQQLKPYRLRASALTCPFTGQPYAVNKSLAGKKLAKIEKPYEILLFWSPKAMPDGNYVILDASGRDRRVASSEFSRLKRTSRIP